MKMKMYSVFDSKISAFSRPFYSFKDASAIREFSDAVNHVDPNNQWNKHPEDFQLFCLGEFDDITGEIIPSLPQALLPASSVHLTDNGFKSVSELSIGLNPNVGKDLAN